MKFNCLVTLNNNIKFIIENVNVHNDGTFSCYLSDLKKTLNDFKFKFTIKSNITDDLYVTVDDDFIGYIDSNDVITFNGLLLMQSPFKDKNGKELYEYDIISNEGAILLYNENLGCWVFKFEQDSYSTPMYYDLKQNQKNLLYNGNFLLKK